MAFGATDSLHARALVPIKTPCLFGFFSRASSEMSVRVPTAMRLKGSLQ